MSELGRYDTARRPVNEQMGKFQIRGEVMCLDTWLRAEMLNS